jgi:dihydroorotase
MTKELVIVRPDDWHLHLRDEDFLPITVNESAKSFARAIIMPNLVPPITKLVDAENYKRRILNALKPNLSFDPLMTLYLTEETDPKEVKEGFLSGQISAVKLYPAGATTNSQSGVRNFEKIKPVLEIMAEIGCPLCIHGEVTEKNIDIFDREKAFIDNVLNKIRTDNPTLKVIMEHITTKDAVDYVFSENENLAATVTTHHLSINRNDLLAGGIRPHFYCLPVVKRETHRLALVEAVVSGSPKFFLGTDSAPHLDRDKESSCGCAGCFTATNSLEILAHIFEEQNALNKLELFTSINGAKFYGKNINNDKIRIVKKDKPTSFPEKISTPSGEITVFKPNFKTKWQVQLQFI